MANQRVSATSLFTALIALLAVVAPLGAHGQNGLCPPGYQEIFNVNEPGCTFCYGASECQIQCLGPPACFCEPGDAACCAATPCCANCPEPKPLECDTSRCGCTPESCCSTICPSTAPAPPSSGLGLGLLATALLVLGAGSVRLAVRRR